MLIGRDKETKQLIQAIENHDNSKLILIGAIAGMGKTTLVSHVLNHQQLKPKTIRIKLSQSSKSFPYQIFHEIATFIITQTTYTPAERDQIRRVLHDWSDLASSFLPNLFSQYSLDSSQIESSLMSSREKKSGELVDFIAELTKTYAGSSPLCIFIDDYHRSDIDSRLLFEKLLKSKHEKSIVYIVAFRKNEIEPHWLNDLSRSTLEASSGSIKIELPRLTNEESLTLLRNRFPQMSQETLRDISLSSKGIPYFLTEAADLGVNKDGFLNEINAKITRLSKRECEVLKFISVIDVVIDPDYVTSLIAPTHSEAISSLNTLVNEGFLIRSNQGYLFRQDILLEAVLAKLSSNDLSRIHLKLFDSLNGKSGQELKASTHLERCYQQIVIRDGASIAVHHLLSACKTCRELNAWESALDFAEKAIGLIETHRDLSQTLAFQTYFLAASTCSIKGDLKKCEEYILFMKALSTTDLDQARIDLLQCEILHTQNKITESVELCLQRLSLMGYKFPRKPTLLKSIKPLLKSWWYIRKLIKKREKPSARSNYQTRSEFCETEIAMALTKRLILLGYSKNQYLIPHAMEHSLALTMEHGLNKYSATAFLAFGTYIVQGVFEQINYGKKIMDFALILNNKFSGMIDRVFSQVMVAGVGYRTMGIEKSSEVALEAIKESKRYGVFDGASYLAHVYAYHALECKIKLVELTDFHQEFASLFPGAERGNVPWYLIISNLFLFLSGDKEVLPENEGTPFDCLSQINEGEDEASKFILLHYQTLFHFLNQNHSKAYYYALKSAEKRNAVRGALGYYLSHFIVPMSISNSGEPLRFKDLIKLISSYMAMARQQRKSNVFDAKYWILRGSILCRLGVKRTGIQALIKGYNYARESSYLDSIIASNSISLAYSSINRIDKARLWERHSLTTMHRWGATGLLSQATGHSTAIYKSFNTNHLDIQRDYKQRKLMEDIFRTCYESAIEGLFSLSSNGVISLANESFRDLVQIPNNYQTTAPAFHTIFQDQSEYERIWKQTHYQLSEFRFVKLLKSDGTPFIGELKLVRKRELGPFAIFGSISDASKEFQSTAILNHLASASHELRHEMQYLLNNIQLWKENGYHLKAEEQNEFIDQLYTNSLSLKQFADQELHLNQILTNNLRGNVAIFPIKAIVDEINSDYFLSKFTLQSEVKFKQRIAPQVDLSTYIESDHTKIKIILWNLLRNAFEHTKSGEIVFNLSFYKLNNGNGKLIISISDTGTGIPPHQLPDIFDIYRKGTSDSSGFGIGLFICKQLVESLGGDVSCESTLAQGSMFTINIPVSIFQSQRKHEDALYISSNSSTYTVLIVDDDTYLSEQLKRLLSKYNNLTVMNKSTGHEAIELLKSTDIDILIIDYHIPDLTGPEVVDIIRNDLQIPHAITRIILTTAEKAVDQLTEMQRNLFDSILHKPAPFDSLINCLAQFIEISTETNKRLQVDGNSKVNFDLLFDTCDHDPEEVQFHAKSLSQFYTNISAELTSCIKESDTHYYTELLHQLHKNAILLNSKHIEIYAETWKETSNSNAMHNISQLLPIVEKEAELFSDELEDLIAELI